MTKICPRCQKSRNNDDFLSVKRNRTVKCCISCRKGAKEYNAKTKNIKPTREKIHKKTMKKISEELQEISFKLATVKKLEKEYRDKLNEMHDEYADHLMNTHYLVLGP